MHGISIGGLVLSTATLYCQRSIATGAAPTQVVAAFLLCGLGGALMVGFPLTEMAHRRHRFLPGRRTAKR